MGSSVQAVIAANRPYSRIPAIFARAKRLMGKNNVTWFLRGQTNDKSCQYKKSPLSLFICLLENLVWIRARFLKGRLT